MKKSELRIGNLLSHYGEIITVDGVDDIDVFNSHIGDIPLHSVHPIELTVEWLEKLGFQNVNNLYFYHSDFCCKIEKLSTRWAVRFMVGTKESITITYIYYVHQLQNLFYVFKNEELSVSV
jgi:hypothetical protein